jgi:hypothetical protein
MSATLLALGGARFDLGVAAARVRRVFPASEGGAQAAIDLFARLGAAPEGPAARLIAIALADGNELIITAHLSIEVITPDALLPLPRIVTRHAPWLDALVLPAPNAPNASDGARPLLVIAPDRVAPREKLPETAPLW